MFVSEVEFMLHKKQLNRVIKIQELKLKLLEKEIKINKIDTRIQLTAMAAILKPSEMSDTDFVLKINEKMSELWSEEALIRQGAKINQELLEIQKTLHQRDQHKCIYCGNRVDPGEKFHHEHNGIKSDQIEYGVLLCMDCHTERHHGKKCNDVKEYCRKYLINLYGESIYSK